MAYWLLKTEPGDYSFDDLERDGEIRWVGVKNNLALKHLREVREGDRAFVYHTGRERAVVGIAVVTSDPYPDPGEDDDKLQVFDLRPEKRLAQPVTLAEIKADGGFDDFALVRLPRLSVMPVPGGVWKKILKMGS